MINTSEAIKIVDKALYAMESLEENGGITEFWGILRDAESAYDEYLDILLAEFIKINKNPLPAIINKESILIDNGVMNKEVYYLFKDISTFAGSKQEYCEKLKELMSSLNTINHSEVEIDYNSKGNFDPIFTSPNRAIYVIKFTALSLAEYYKVKVAGLTDYKQFAEALNTFQDCMPKELHGSIYRLLGTAINFPTKYKMPRLSAEKVEEAVTSVCKEIFELNIEMQALYGKHTIAMATRSYKTASLRLNALEKGKPIE